MSSLFSRQTVRPENKQTVPLYQAAGLLLFELSGISLDVDGDEFVKFFTIMAFSGLFSRQFPVNIERLFWPADVRWIVVSCDDEFFAFK